MLPIKSRENAEFFLCLCLLFVDDFAKPQAFFSCIHVNHLKIPHHLTEFVNIDFKHLYRCKMTGQISHTVPITRVKKFFHTCQYLEPLLQKGSKVTNAL